MKGGENLKYTLLSGMIDGSKHTCLCDFERPNYLIGYIQSGKFIDVPICTKADFENIRVQTDKQYNIHAADDEQAKSLALEMLDILYGGDSYSDIVGGGR